MLFLSSCFEDCPPTKPEEEILLYGDIDAHYFRLNAEYSEGSDIVRMFVSWINFQGILMNKVEEDHFQLELKRVPNNIEHIGSYEHAHFIRIVDAKCGRQVTEKVVLNGTELKNVGETLETDISLLYFWFDGKKVHN